MICLVHSGSVRRFTPSGGRAFFALWIAALAIVWAALPPVVSGASSDVRAVPWTLTGVEGKKTILVRLRVSHCAGYPRPQLERVGERATGESIVVSIFMRFRKPENPTGTCAGLRLKIGKRIRLSAAIDERSLFDGSSSPPQLRRGSGS